MEIRDLDRTDADAVRQAAQLLVIGFPPEHWTNLADGLAEIDEILTRPENVIRMAVDAAGTVLGWVGALHEYSGHTWQLHPLVVHPAHQGQGIGRALVRDLERLAAGRGVTTIYLGTDDEYEQTSLGGVDLYPDVASHMATIENRNRHPFEFYRKMGFAIVGLIPDANGPGKPDILMAKRVAR